ncbi:hypothetical protein LTR05_002127 [Lithohypha guttulata]|uniref:FAD linked oxidase N-terminal domain-containing protein n=1 Tax=Lithohypha guttulata TaxID=1690604 RepID=A0AAN7T1V4_9EURO|nr:hypothetical protein LTR05_002127 [Lithohypha guttulata]
MYSVEILLLATAATTLASLQRAETHASYTPNNLTVAFCCEVLELAGLGDLILYPGAESYDERVGSYWSEAAQLTPTCFVQPRDAVEVAQVVSTLVESNNTYPCKFAVRSAGHTTWAGSNNIEDGVTIDLGLINNTIYYAENSTAGVGPGARWLGVYKTLDALNIAAAGGRAGTVGVVLSSGAIVDANNETNPDLFRALKGGNNNFGIVTRFDLEVFETTLLWGGVVVYPNDTTPAQLQALKNFCDKIESNPYGSAIGIWQFTSQTDATIIINAYDYTAAVERPAVYDEFLAIPGNISDSLRITNMSDLTQELEQAAGYRDSFFTLTFKNDIRMYEKAIQMHNSYVELIKASEAAGNWTLQDMFQPLPAIFAKHSVEMGGNMLGLDRFDENLVLWQTYLAWQAPDQDDLFHSFGDAFIAELKDYAISIGADNPFIYLDYAYKTQDPLASYGKENYDHIKAMAEKYDPLGVFQTMVPGGFKISKAGEPIK